MVFIISTQEEKMSIFYEANRIAICVLRDIATGKNVLVGHDDEFALDESNPETVYDTFSCSIPLDEAKQTTVLADELLKNGFVLRSYQVTKQLTRLDDYYINQKKNRKYSTTIYIHGDIDILSVDSIKDKTARGKIQQPPYIIE
ncbi:hypothetical protein A2707_01635 [Candidatus Saccharibacteria bacterium RIFCSPHIGHO2_01_FULL_45_15]|nr:MAG: hypothetical protein A2707_01635 [Candidatus Saccharibacteria bacterium RIFCSPHIGHO2_01_FULL_45_15]OGL31714.1 MAG: hypothetical protein A3E76_01205 [Candidatus Saccharibacteria bacterium RIFCSPHIGHO2_12_FULL_44_22]